MNSIQLMKEARQLLWPWSLVTLAALLSLLHFRWDLIELIVMGGAFLGIPLLATLPLGAEFQYRTVTLLLAQPIPRQKIWRKKMLMTLAAVLPPAVVYGIRAGRDWRAGAEQFWLVAAILIVALTSGAMFWTLRARSTIGGLALNACSLGLLEFAWLSLGDRLGLVGRHDQIAPSYLWATAALVPFYAAGMIWLGRRALLRFQVVEGLRADATAMPGAQFVPRFVSDWLRCRPAGVALNLVRRELRLLRPVWLLALLTLVTWIGLLLFHQLPARGGPPSPGGVPPAALILAITLSPVIATLAGPLSLGEEKTMGTHDWHMTLPVPVGLQWLVKLSVAICASVVCAALLPVTVLLAGGVASGNAFRYVDPDALWLWPLAVSLLTLIGFWCSSMVKGAVRAALWIFPTLFFFSLATRAGTWVSDSLSPAAARWFDLILFQIDSFRVTKAVSAWDMMGIEPWVLPVPVAVFLLVHSHRLFQAQAEDTNRHIARCLLPVVMVVFLGSFLAWDAVALVQRAHRHREILFRETHRAIAKVQSGAVEFDPAHPLRISAGELAKTSPMSEVTRHWLGDATIIVVAERRAHVPRSVEFLEPLPPDHRPPSYVAVMPLTNGSVCTMAFQKSATEYGTLGGLCD